MRELVPHNITSPIGTIAACHVCASIPNFLALEHHTIDVPWWEKILKREEKLIHGGFIKVPEKPGIGVEIDETEIKKHLKDDEYPF